MKRAVYVVDDKYVATRIQKLMEIQGEVGFIIKVGLFSGLREEEIIFFHSKEICPDNAGHKCDKMHVIDKPNNGMSEVGIKFMDLRKLHYNVVRITMDPNEADVLAGRAKTVSAQHYALYQLDKMTESYVHAWEKFGIRFR